MGPGRSKFRALTLRKRNIVERKALRLLRGDFSRAAGTELASQQDVAALFGDLLARAGDSGMRIQPVEAACLTADELLILRWLAEAQRETGLRTFRPADAALLRAINRCADLLKMLDVQLPSRTLRIGVRPSDHGDDHRAAL